MLGVRMSLFLRDAGALTLAAGAVTTVITLAVRFLFRRGKGLEEP
jgi:hypothetical protein